MLTGPQKTFGGPSPHRGPDAPLPRVLQPQDYAEARVEASFPPHPTPSPSWPKILPNKHVIKYSCNYKPSSQPLTSSEAPAWDGAPHQCSCYQSWRWDGVCLTAPCAEAQQPVSGSTLPRETHTVHPPGPPLVFLCSPPKFTSPEPHLTREANLLSSPPAPYPSLPRNDPCPLWPFQVRSCLLSAAHRLAGLAEPSGALWGLPTSCRSGPAATASPGSLLEMQNLVPGPY